MPRKETSKAPNLKVSKRLRNSVEVRSVSFFQRFLVCFVHYVYIFTRNLLWNATQEKDVSNDLSATTFYYGQQFKRTWTELDVCKGWLEGRKSNNTNELKAHCIPCSSFMSNHLKQLKNHADSEKHILNQILYKKCEEERQKIAQYVGSGQQRKIVEMELKLCSFIADENLPLSLIDPLLDVLRSCFPETRSWKDYEWLNRRHQTSSETVIVLAFFKNTRQTNIFF